MTITSKMEYITPKIAAEYLLRNLLNNRNLRPTYVSALASAMARGEWQQNHQGIAFNSKGQLVDGQHRLSAIIQSGISVYMLVTRGLGMEAFPTLDMGAKRTMADATGIRKACAETATYLFRILCPGAVISAATTTFIYETFRPSIDLLIDRCGTTRRTITSAPVKAAAVCQMIFMPDKAEFVLDTYTKLVHRDFDKFTQTQTSFYKQVVDKNIIPRGQIQVDIFARAMVVFDANKAHLSKIQIDDPLKTVSDARELLMIILPQPNPFFEVTHP